MAIWHVDKDATGKNDGTSRRDAWTHIREAFNSDDPKPGDFIGIRPDHYTFSGNSNRKVD